MVTVQSYIPINSVGGFPFLRTLSRMVGRIFNEDHFNWCGGLPQWKLFCLHKSGSLAKVGFLLGTEGETVLSIQWFPPPSALT